MFQEKKQNDWVKRCMDNEVEGVRPPEVDQSKPEERL